MNSEKYQEFTLIGETIGLEQIGLDHPLWQHYEMAVTDAEVNDVTVTEDAIIFHATEPFPEDVTQEPFTYDRYISLVELAGAEKDGVRTVPDRNAAEIINEHCTWVETDGQKITFTEEATCGEPKAVPSWLHIYERIPIDEPPTNVSEYEALLNEYLETDESVNL